MKVLLTGAAGFIGMHVARVLLDRGDSVIGIDNLNDYYDPNVKRGRLGTLRPSSGFKFVHGDISDRQTVERVFSEENPRRVINLAAQAGVRYSINNPHTYVQSNLVGFMNILEACRHARVEHLVYASSSSVYGGNTKMPLSVADKVDRPLSLYAATKKANELMAHTYSHLYDLPTTGLRYFTVYGPWGRPDMAPWLFTDSILEGRTISVFNNGNMKRDFTFIDDVAEGTVRTLDCVPNRNRTHSSSTDGCAPYRVYNIGNRSPVSLLDFIKVIEVAVGAEANKELLPMQPGDVRETCADIDDIERDVGFTPRTGLTEGIGKWVAWYLDYKERSRRTNG
jgi:UDP-glucuronate 4-epimerase